MSKSDREYERELSAMPKAEQEQVRAIMGTPVGAAVALHREIQASREAVSALVGEVRINTEKTMKAVAELSEKIGIQNHRIGCLERDQGALEDRVDEIEAKVNNLAERMGEA
ncbi:MAG: hypothetical protein PHS14_08000 [Elusimicrobia bacterium]|nr:hypothetical protein [Elusimicrobiota bacterium]